MVILPGRLPDLRIAEFLNSRATFQESKISYPFPLREFSFSVIANRPQRALLTSRP
jgi:hypothetical protein